MPAPRQHPHDDDLPIDPDLDDHAPASWVTTDHLVATAPTARILGVIGAGGALGGVARYVVAEALPTSPGGFPWATLLVNASGSLLLGLLMVLVAEVLAPSPYVRPFLGVGVLGGFTTFSTYTGEVRALLEGGSGPLALVYLFATVGVCLVATLLGIRLGRLVEARRA